jgi:hypothetical protein
MLCLISRQERGEHFLFVVGKVTKLELQNRGDHLHLPLLVPPPYPG